MQIPEQTFDLVVIGSGPGARGGDEAVKQGQSVAVVERHDNLGGGCVHWGTIPSKSLRYMIFRMTDTNNNPVFRAAGASLKLSFPELRKAAGSVIQRQVDMRTSFYDRNSVPIFHGHARFLDPHRIEIEESTGVRRLLKTSAVVVATGSRPEYRPPDIDFSHPRIFDSDTILNLNFTPQSITVYGGAVSVAQHDHVPQPQLQGESDQHGEAARVPRRRDHRCARLPHAGSRRLDPAQ